MAPAPAGRCIGENRAAPLSDDEGFDFMVDGTGGGLLGVGRDELAGLPRRGTEVPAITVLTTWNKSQR
jgi:hypothetical protein